MHRCCMTTSPTRVPMPRIVDGHIPGREDHGTTSISTVEEVLVVEKRVLLREDLPIRTQCIETHEPQWITLRSEDVQVERALTPMTRHEGDVVWQIYCSLYMRRSRPLTR